MRQHLGEQLGQRRASLKQAEQVDPAGKPIDDIAQPIERMIRIGANRDCLQQVGQHGFERLLRRWRTQ